jgi:GWxTD domain-containing protein
MRIISLIIIILYLHIAYGQPDFSTFPSQSMAKGKYSPQGGPILVKPYPLSYANNQFKMLILVELVYDMLQFTFKDDEYWASFDTEIIFQEKKSRQTYTKVWPSTFSLKDYDLTNRGDRFFLTWDSLFIPPGEYQLTFEYRDLQGKQKFHNNMNLTLPAVKNLYAPSPLFMVDSEKDESLPLPFPARPLASWGKLPFNQKIKMLLNIYSNQDSRLQVSLNIHKKNASQPSFILDSLVYTVDNQGFLLLDIPFQQWPEGKYEAKIIYRGEQDSLIQQIPVDIIWMDKPRSLRIPEYAIQPLKVILPEAEFKEINSGSKEERHKKFEQFWQSKDPTPSTAYNEIMVEFYDRVDSVDQLWGEKRIFGWKTDPGRIILLYGQPDEVEDNSLNPIKPYLRWTYFLANRTLTFTFQPLEGRKRYRLIQEEEIPVQ